jgi:hypothetical protein
MAKLPLAPAAALGLLSPSLHLLPRDLVLPPRGMASSMAPAPPAPTAVVAHNAPPETTAAVAPPATARTRREEEGTEEERERRCPAGDGGHDAEAVTGVVHGANSLLASRPVPIQARPLLLGPSPPLLRACAATGQLRLACVRNRGRAWACVRACVRNRGRARACARAPPLASSASRTPPRTGTGEGGIESREILFVGCRLNQFIEDKGSLVFFRSSIVLNNIKNW